MRMSTHNFLEASDPSWKILVNATQRASVAEGHLKTKKKCSSLEVVKSYEQFVQELGQINRDYADNADPPTCDQTSTNCAENIVEENNAYLLGEWNSDEEIETDDDDGYPSKDENNNENFKQTRNKHGGGSEKYKDVVKNGCWSDTSSSFSSGNDDINYEDKHALSQEDENDWESLSSCSQDLTFEDFLKDLKIPREEIGDSANKYTTLTECVMRHYYPESESGDHCSCKQEETVFGDDYNKDFSRHGQLKLEERLPLMQVIDALEDVNKILKNGEITPNMERLLEYKQDYPFTEGYAEEKLGWCPYIVYRIEKFVKKISAKQWPY